MREIRERKKDIDRKVNRRKREECVCARREREKLADERSGEGEKRRVDGAVNEHAAPREERRGRRRKRRR